MDRYSRDDLLCTYNILIKYIDFLINRENEHMLIVNRSIQPELIQSLSSIDSQYVINQNQKTVNEIEEYISFLSKMKEMFEDFYSRHYENPNSYSTKETEHYFDEHKSHLISIINSLGK